MDEEELDRIWYRGLSRVQGYRSTINGQEMAERENGEVKAEGWRLPVSECGAQACERSRRVGAGKLLGECRGWKAMSAGMVERPRGTAALPNLVIFYLRRAVPSSSPSMDP